MTSGHAGNEAGGGGGRLVRLTPEILRESFSGEFRPGRLSPLYQLTLLLVAAVMLLMPVVYLGLVGLTGYGVYYHATEHMPDFSARRVGLGRVILWIAPIIAGSIAVLFMLKPLLAPRRRGAEPFTVQPDEEPLLAQYVEMVCTAMHAPIPRRIDVDAQANASASFRRGFLSFFGNDLVLTLGLPLVAAMDLRQLTGVLAHELGHFRQGWAMRMTYIIHRINAWLARVVYERDAWDERLERAARDGVLGHFIFIILTAQLCVWISRQVLKILMYIALGVSSFMSRQMEFDADRCETIMAGSVAFGPTARRILELGAAWNEVEGQLHSRWAERRLPDDLPAFVAASAANLPSAVMDEMVTAAMEHKGGLFSTHPPMPKRIAAAERMEAPGMFQLEVPARSLFRDFRSVCRKATYIHYRAVLGQDIFQATLVPADQIIQQQAEEIASGEAYKRYFPGMLGQLRPIYPEVLEIKPPRNPKEALADLQDARQHLQMCLEEFEAPAERFIKAADRAVSLRVAREVVGAGLRTSGSELGLSKVTVDTIKAEMPIAEQARDAAEAAIEPVISTARKRLVTALSLLMVSGIEKRLPKAIKHRERLPALLSTLHALNDTRSSLRLLRADLTALLVLFDNFKGNEKSDKYHNRVREVSLRLHRHVQSVQAMLSVTIYPYEHSRGTVTVAEVLRTGAISTPDYPVELAQNAQAMMIGCMELCWRTLSELALMAEDVERTLKLPPLKAPEAKRPPEGEKGKKKGKGREKKESELAVPV